MRLVLILIFSWFAASCNFKNFKKNETRYFIEPDSVAVLPFDNMSTDITAEDMMRQMVISAFTKKGWNVIPKEQVDEKLKQIGITDGGQLNSVSSSEIASLTGARYLCYGIINDFKFQNLGFIVLRKVEFEMKIYDSVKNDFIFDETGTGSDTEVYLNKDEAKKAFIKHNAMKLIENIAKRPLYKQATESIDRIFSKF